MRIRFQDRHDAGRHLAALLEEYAARPGVIVLGLPRGGIPVAYEVARRLGLPLDVFVVRKLGVPGSEETAMGAIASGDVCVLNEPLIAQLGLSRTAVERVRAHEQLELERRETAYRGVRPPVDVHGSTVLVVDDGLATGATMKAAVMALRAQHVAKIIAAVPVASRPACAELSKMVDCCVCVSTPAEFFGVGLWYDDFSQTTDDTVRSLLAHAALLLPDDLRLAAARSHHLHQREVTTDGHVR
jgi:putative phosphoribosyl transferase